MVSESIFVDTSMFKAMLDRRDDFHGRAKKIWQDLAIQKRPTVTNNFILDETFTLLRVKCGRKTVAQFREELANDFRYCRVYRVLAADEVGAWNWFNKDWRSLSFTDCVSFAMMKRMKIQEVTTFDMHFKRAGFRIVQ
ncbi:hypothetical protein A2W24_04650 [Microgenomates group bacterium RBG_16_45_19]|nr:MAG: hypothetical protein A2W24_04650 [Microgenomates group bacterium RBG_16_45_19]